jgi:hypothetical protein
MQVRPFRFEEISLLWCLCSILYPGIIRHSISFFILSCRDIDTESARSSGCLNIHCHSCGVAYDRTMIEYRLVQVICFRMCLRHCFMHVAQSLLCLATREQVLRFNCYQILAEVTLCFGLCTACASGRDELCPARPAVQ